MMKINTSENEMICKRLEAFRAELARKRRDDALTVNETRFICERALMLLRNYHRVGISPLKETTVAGLQQALEYHGQNHQGRLVTRLRTQPCSCYAATTPEC